MLILTETTDNIQVVLGAAVTTNQLRCVTSWRDITTTTFTPGRSVNNTNDTTDVNIVGSPAASTQRVCDLINIYNSDTVGATVTVKFDANGTEYILWSGVLGSGQTLYYQEGFGWSVSNGSLGYTLLVQSLTTNPADGTTAYFGSIPATPTTTAGQRKVYVPTAGIVRAVEIYSFATTAGSNEAWSMNFRLNNTTNTLIATVSVSANERRWTNLAMAVTVGVGDYFEIQDVHPTWGTNPATVINGGYVYIT